MKDMGFNPASSNSAQEAFVKYLIKQSTGVNVQTPTEKKIIEQYPEKIVSLNKQLSFDFMENENSTETETRKKA